MKNLIHTAVVTLFAASAAHAQQAVQWKVSDGGNGHWYGAEYQFRLWADAKLYAESVGGHLATTTSQPELDALRPLINNSSGADYWLGASRSTNTDPWLWVTSEPFSFTHWAPGEPDNGPESICLEVIGQPGSANFNLWNDETYYAWGGGNYSIIEWDADCNNDSIVDYGQCHDGTLPDYNGNNTPDCCERGEACVVGSYPVQWRIEDGGNGHWYRMVTTGTIGWHQARSVAVGVGGDLASITTLEESEFVLVVTSNPSGWVSDGPYLIGPWLGGYQDHSAPDYHEPAGGWRWVSGETWQFTRWLSPEPNNGWGGGEDFLNLLTQPPVRGISPYWNDSPANSTNNTITSLVVEWSADCNGDGIVDYGQIVAGQLADLNGNGVPDICQEPTCRDADLYRNNRIDGADLGILLSEWGPVTPSTNSDINKDGSVNGADLGLLLSFWGACQN